MCFCAGSGRLALNTPGAAGPSGAERDTGGGAAGEVTALCWAASPAKVGSLPHAEHCPVHSSKRRTLYIDVFHVFCWAATPCRCPLWRGTQAEQRPELCFVRTPALPQRTLAGWTFDGVSQLQAGELLLVVGTAAGDVRAVSAATGELAWATQGCSEGCGPARWPRWLAA